MINTSRRRTLKLVSATLATAGTASLAPLKALAGLVPAAQNPPLESLPEPVAEPLIELSSLQQEATNIVFSVDRQVDHHISHSVVTILNRSDAAMTLRYIQPGFVHAEGYTYDLNQLLKDGPLTLASGEVVRLPLAPITSAISANADSGWQVPGGLVSDPVVVKTRLGQSSELHSVKTLRSLFS